jgi:hypothetical protein
VFHRERRFGKIGNFLFLNSFITKLRDREIGNTLVVREIWISF